ncbi:hypothetical protein VYU27_000447 [Nannochloropsis oceanica]
MATTRRDPSQEDVDEASSTLRACVDRDLLAEICHGDSLGAGNHRASTHSSLVSTSSPPWKDESLHKCRPWSEADFFHRLRTFTPQHWFGKSLLVAPPRCAAQGWVNSSTDTLECQICQATLTLPSNSEPAPDILSSSHSITCPWAHQACEPDVSHFPLVTAECLLTHTARRMGGIRPLLQAYKGDLTVKVPEEFNKLMAGCKIQGEGVGEGRDGVGSLTLEALARRVEECIEDDAGGGTAGAGAREGGGVTVEEEKREDEQALELKGNGLILALHGWEAGPPPRQPESGGRGGRGWALICGMCGRRVEVGRVVDRRSSLGSGRMMEGGGEKGEDVGRAKARRVGGMAGPAAFDVMNQHRWWCAWVSRGLDEKGQPGWRLTLKTLVGRMRRMVELGKLMEDEGDSGDRSWGVGSSSSSYARAKRLLDGM